MKSMTFVAFGLLVLVAVAVANPLEEEDETNNEVVADVEDQSR